LTSVIFAVWRVEDCKRYVGVDRCEAVVSCRGSVTEATRSTL
jgi:hypothetical protein